MIFISETWQNSTLDFHIDGFESYCVPRTESLNKTSKRGHGGICLFYSTLVSDGVTIVDTDVNGIIWVKLCKQFFNLDDDIYICFAYVPPQNSVYFALHPIGFYESIEAGVRKYSDLGKVALIGDLNSRCGNVSDTLQSRDDFARFINVIETDYSACDASGLSVRKSMDSVTNASGQKLIDLCRCTDLRIVNGRMGV